MIDNLNFESFFHREKYKQIIKYKNKKEYCYVLKRNKKDCKIPLHLILYNKEMKEFIYHGLKEYVIGKIISSHPAGIQVFDFKISYIKQQEFLVTELLMEEAADTLLDFICNPKEEKKFDFVKIFTQISSIMRFFEKHKIYHSDVKMENFLIAEENLRIIDFDVAQDKGFIYSNTSQETSKVLGYTNGYVPPEIYKQIGKLKNRNQIPIKVNPWRADIYSCGIVGLGMSGALNNFDQPIRNEIDSYKIYEEKHQKVIVKCKLVKCNGEDLTKKMQYILEVCLSYEPNMRITFKRLNEVMLKIQDKNYDLRMLQDDVGIYIDVNKKCETKNQKMYNPETLKKQFNSILLTNQELENELKQLQQKYLQEFKGVNIKEIKLEESLSQNKDLAKSTNKLQDNIIMDHNEKTQVLLNTYKNSKDSTLLDLRQEIIKISENVRLFESLLIENKIIKEENLKLKRLIQEQEKSNSAKIITNKKLSKFTVKTVNYIEILHSLQKDEKITTKNIREKINKRISYPSFWSLYKLSLTKSEILQILLIGSSSTTLKGIFFYGNEYFDEECGEAYEKFILKSNSMFGIDLYKLNFSRKQKLHIIYLVKEKKKNVKVAIIEREGTNEQEANQIAYHLGWQLKIYKSRHWKCKRINN